MPQSLSFWIKFWQTSFSSLDAWVPEVFSALRPQDRLVNAVASIKLAAFVAHGAAKTGTRSKKKISLSVPSSVHNSCRFLPKVYKYNIVRRFSFPAYICIFFLQFPVILVGGKSCGGQSSLCASELMVKSIFFEGLAFSLITSFFGSTDHNVSTYFMWSQVCQAICSNQLPWCSYVMTFRRFFILN